MLYANLPKGLRANADAGQQQQEPDNQPTQGFSPAVAVRMLLVGRLGSDL
jgi:hypothetical protein